MTVMVTEVYDALREAGASEEKYFAAAEILAQADQRFGKIVTDLVVLKTDLALVKWMMGFTLAGVGALVVHTPSQ